MKASNQAAAYILEALKDPGLTASARAGLVAALQAVTGSTPASTPAPKTTPTPAVKAKRDAPRGERVKLTKTGIEALPLPASGERLIYDATRPRLAVRLRPNGKSWIVILWDRERRRKVSATLGRCADLTPEKAREQCDRLLGEAASGVDIRRTRESGKTLGDLIEDWHEFKKSKGVRTATEMRDKALDHLGTLADRPASEVTREDIGRIHHHVATKGRRRVLRRVDDKLVNVEVGKVGVPATADKFLAILGSVYGWAQAKGLVADNPTKSIQRAFDAKEASRTNYLHGEALARFWQALEADADEDTRDVIKLALYSGARRGNVLAMAWNDVDLDVGHWTISAVSTKGKKTQVNALSGQAREILARRFADASSPWVFPAVRATRQDEPLGHMSETRPRDAWARICEAAEIQGLRFHDLRHTAGSWLARLGSNTSVRQRALGHATSQMAERYSHLELDPVADAMQRMSDAITAAATKPMAKVRTLKSAK